MKSLIKTLKVKGQQRFLLTQAVSVSGHGWHDAPALAAGVVTLHRVEGLQAISSPHHIQAVIQNRHAELQPSTAHDGHLSPCVPP